MSGPWAVSKGKQQTKAVRLREVVTDPDHQGTRIRYGLGMLVGIAAVEWMKRKLTKVPVIGLIAGPVLGLMPTLVVGPAIGAAVVYGLERGDIMAAPKELRPKVERHVRKAQERLDTIVRSLDEDAASFTRSTSEALSPIEQKAAEIHKATMDANVVRDLRKKRRSLATIIADLDDEL